MIRLKSPNQAMIRNTMTNVDSAFAELGRQIAPVTLPVAFDLSQDASGFIRACRDAARLAITSSLKVRFIYLEHRGFDTHGKEKEPLTDLLNTLNKGLTPLIQTLKASDNGTTPSSPLSVSFAAPIRMAPAAPTTARRVQCSSWAAGSKADR